MPAFKLITTSLTLSCSRLQQAECNKTFLSHRSGWALVEDKSLFGGSCPSVGELCWGMLDTCLPRIQSLKGQLCGLPFICFWICPNEAELILQSATEITQLLPAAEELVGF